ncbi:MAG: DUF1934 domain-containing protein [Oscillospiraceae bacterium]|nr:DUF1934 domain-containing protein [Oscillospiraceae bacterium]
MEKEMILSIKSSQNFEGAGDDAVELVTTGSYEPTDDGWRITYRESEVTGLGDTLTTFDVGADEIILTRSGKVNSKMVFQRGKRHLSVYRTQFGEMTIGVGVKKIVNTLTDRGGNLEIKYTIDINQTVTGVNAVKINVREPGRSLAN